MIDLLQMEKQKIATKKEPSLDTLKLNEVLKRELKGENFIKAKVGRTNPIEVFRNITPEAFQTIP